MAGRQFGLDNLCAVVDRNRLQISGNTEDVMGEDDLEARFASFGWHVIQADGNSVPAMKAAFAEARRTTGKPTFIIANTTKGKGSSVMENKASWHHHVPDEEEYETIMRDLAAAKELLDHDFSAPVTENMTLFAKWVEDVRTVIIFHMNDGSEEMGFVLVNEDGRCPYQLLTPTRVGYTFAGWFTAPTGGERVTDETVYTEDTELYAQWNKVVAVTLPAALVTIEEEAFEGIDAVRVEIAENVVSIGPRAFADCVNLREFFVPATVEHIDDTALQGSDFVIVYGETGSEAQRFAEANGIPFVAMNATYAVE